MAMMGLLRSVLTALVTTTISRIMRKSYVHGRQQQHDYNGTSVSAMVPYVLRRVSSHEGEFVLG